MAGRTGSPRSRVPVLAAEPVRTTSCGNRVFTDVIKSRVSRRDDPGLRGQVPNPVASVLIGHGGGYPEKRGRQGRLSRGHEARNCELGAGRGRKDPPERLPGLALRHPDSGLRFVELGHSAPENNHNAPGHQQTEDWVAALRNVECLQTDSTPSERLPLRHAGCERRCRCRR